MQQQKPNKEQQQPFGEEAELAVAKAEAELGVAAKSETRPCRRSPCMNKRLAEEADFAKAAQEEVAVLHTKLQLATNVLIVSQDTQQH